MPTPDQTVQHMICPCCTQPHGREHHPTCPHLFKYGDREVEGAYELGWLAGREHLHNAIGDLVDQAFIDRDQAQAAFVTLLFVLHMQGALP